MFVAELALQAASRARDESVGRMAVNMNDYERSMVRVRDEVAYEEAVKWRAKLEALEHELREAHVQVEGLRRALDLERADRERERGRHPPGTDSSALPYLALSCHIITLSL